MADNFRLRDKGGLTPEQVAFSQAVSLAGYKTMAPQLVGGPLTFSAASGRALGGQSYVRLVADGVNTPTFPGFAEFGSSAGYNNTAGILNAVSFWFDGVTNWYSIQQAVNAVPIVTPAVSSATITAVAPDQISVVFSASLNSGSTPSVSAFSVSNSGGSDTVTSVGISGSTVTLTKSRTTLSSDVVTLSYTVPGSSSLVSNDGLTVATFAGQAVNNQLASQNVRLATLSQYTESGNSGAGYSYQATGNNLSATLATNSDYGLSANGYLQAKLSGNATGTSIFFLDDANDAANYTGCVLGIQVNGAGSNYLICRLGTANNVANGTQVAATLNDLIRIERVGTTGLVSVSKDNGSTWTLLHTLTSMTGSRLYPKVNGGPSGTIWGPLTGFGVT